MRKIEIIRFLKPSFYLSKFGRNKNRVRVGEPFDRQTRKIVRTFIHKNYNQETMKNDIALLKLDVNLMKFF
jgi:hypothetical protein